MGSKNLPSAHSTFNISSKDTVKSIDYEILNQLYELNFLDFWVMLQFCGDGSSLSEPWTQHGFSPCFLETVASSILAGFLMIGGTVMLIMYRRHSTLVEKKYQPESCLYVFQILLTLTMAIENIVRVVLTATVLGNKKVNA